MNRTQPFGRYELLDRISAGGMAEVFRARDAQRGGAIVALKKILPHVAEDEEFIEMFTDEARIASSLEHPHIARTLDFGSIGSSYYIAFEYVRGKDLRTVFDRSVKTGEPIPLPYMLYVFARIGEGLSYAHARKDAAGSPVSIVHRDVSPQNIVVSFGGDVKLIDFGIAKAAGKLSRTAVGAIKGKFGYMSPEQVRGLEVDQRTDVFSLGITMWELFTRQRLFAAENELLVLEKIRNLKVTPPSSIDPTLPPELDEVILKALAKDPDDRYQSAKELYRDLNILAQGSGKSASREDVAAYMQRAFPESPPEPQEPQPESQSGPRVTPSRPGSAGLSYNAENSMAADKSPAQSAGANDKRSDLDIFEGLGKKNGPPPRTSAPPAPPPSRAPAPPPPPSMGDVGKKTLMGIAAPAGLQQNPPPMRPPMSQPAPPPPARASLPAVNAPPQKSSPPGPPPAASTKPAPYGVAPQTSGAGLDMDWDDEDEATHIFDKETEGSQAGPMPSSPKPAAGMPAAGMPPAPPTSPLLASPGLPPRSSAPPRPPSSLANTMAASAPPPPPGRSAPPPPPSSVGATFARASGQVAGSPLINHQALNQQSMTMPLGATSPLSNQLHTEPLKMPPQPPRPPSAAPPPQPPGNFAMTSPLQQNNPFLHQSVPSAPPPPQMHQQQQQQHPMGPPPGMQSYDMPVPQAPRAMEATALVRPPQSSKAGLVVAVLVALLVIGGAAAAYLFLVPHTGNIAVNVTDAKGGGIGSLEVYLDGRKVCDTAPCRIDQVKAGSHELKVSAQGYDQPSAKLVAVESGKDAQVDMTLASSATKGTGFKVTGTQPGVKLLVDNKEIGALPQELRDLEPGAHALKFVGTLKSAKGEDRYASMDKNITVGKDEVQDLGTVTLKVLIGKATITLGTPGASVKLVASNGDQRTPTQYPVSIEIDTSKASWTIDATKTGMTEYKQPINFDDGQAERFYNVQLDPKGTTPTIVTNGGGGGGGGGGAVVVHPAGGGGGGGGTTAPTGGGGGGTTAPTGGGAHLTINAIPVAGTIAILDGKPIGAVPKKDFAVSPGAHTILFINSEKSLRKSITVNVADGESKPAFTKLDE